MILATVGSPLIESCLRHKNEAAHVIVNLKRTSIREMGPAVILQLFSGSSRAPLPKPLRFACNLAWGTWYRFEHFAVGGITMLLKNVAGWWIAFSGRSRVVTSRYESQGIYEAVVDYFVRSGFEVHAGKMDKVLGRTETYLVVDQWWWNKQNLIRSIFFFS
jgi:hypothetical protein